MKRIFKPSEIILIIVFAAIGIAAIFFGSYTMEQYEIKKAERGLFSQNAFALSPRDYQNGTDISRQISDFTDAHPGTLVYQVLFERRSYSVMFAGQQTSGVNIRSGDFFTAEQSKSGEAFCVIGTGVMSNARTGADVKRYYTNNNEQFILLGSVGYNITSDINQICLYNMGHSGAPLVRVCPFVIDCPDAAQTEALKTEFTALLKAAGSDAVEIAIPTSQFTVSGFFNMDLLSMIMLIFAGFCIVLSTVPLTLLWASGRRKRAAVQRLLGFTTGYVCAEMFLRLLLLFHIGFALSYGIYALLTAVSSLKLASFFSSEMLIAYLGALIFNILIAVVPLVQTLRVEPGDALRRE